MTTARIEDTAGDWVPDGDFADRLAQVRSRMGMNYKQVGALCGIDSERWSRWELEGNKPRDYEQACRQISEATGCSYIWLLSGQTQNGGQPPKRPNRRQVRREGLEPPTRWLSGVVSLMAERRRRNPRAHDGDPGRSLRPAAAQTRNVA